MSILSEITKFELGATRRFLKKGGKLSFDNIFGDRKRIAKPLTIEDPFFKKLKEFAEKNDFIIDFSTGTLTFFMLDTPGEDGKRDRMQLEIKQAEEFLSSDKWRAKAVEKDIKVIKKNVKIGKFLQKVSKLMGKYVKAKDEFEQFTPRKNAEQNRDKSREEVRDIYRKKSEELYGKAQDISKKLGNLVPQEFTSPGRVLPVGKKLYSDLSDWWNKSSKYYRENPDEAAQIDSAYQVIYTRHPIDVARMSDHKGMTSCHTPPSREDYKGEGGYFNDAVAESLGNAPVAFVVPTKELKELRKIASDLDIQLPDDAPIQEVIDALEARGVAEIFRDDSRQVPGIAPVSRVRFKKLQDGESGEFFALPSTSVYGANVPGLDEELFRFAKETQVESFKKIKEANPDGVKASKIKRFGGQYQDEGDYAVGLLPFFFDSMDIPYVSDGKIGFDDSSMRRAREIPGARELRDAKTLARRFSNITRFLEVTGVVEADEGGFAFDCKFGFTIALENIELFTGEKKGLNAEKRDALKKALKEMTPDILGYLESEGWELDKTVEEPIVVEPGPSYRTTIDFFLFAGEGYKTVPLRKFKRFLKFLEKYFPLKGGGPLSDGVAKIVKTGLQERSIMSGLRTQELIRYIEAGNLSEFEYTIGERGESILLLGESSVDISKVISNFKIEFSKRSAGSINLRDAKGRWIGDAYAIHKFDSGDAELVGWELKTNDSDSPYTTLGEAEFKTLSGLIDYAKAQAPMCHLWNDKGKMTHDFKTMLTGKLGIPEYMVPRVLVEGPSTTGEYTIIMAIWLETKSGPTSDQEADMLLKMLQKHDGLVELEAVILEAASTLLGGDAIKESKTKRIKKFAKYNFNRRNR